MVLDYSRFGQTVNPMQIAQQGITIAQAIDQGQMQQQKMAQYNQQLEKQKAFQTDLQALGAKPSANDYQALIQKYPTMGASLKSGYDVLSEKEQQAKVNQGTQIYAALDAGRPDIAIDFIDKMQVAAMNSGDQQGADSAKALKMIIEQNPEAGLKTAGIFLANTLGVEKFSENLQRLRETNRDDELQSLALDKAAADLNLTKQQAKEVRNKTEKLGFEAEKAALELEAARKGGMDAGQRFDKEKTLRAEYQKRTNSFSEGKRNLDLINTSAADNSGAGDIALITSFMKMLDPGSVVRETEFATAKDTSGLLTTLSNQVEKLQTGEFLSPEQRKNFSNLAKKYFEAAEKEQKGVKKDLDFVVKNYKLNPENVFGTDSEEEQPKETVNDYDVLGTVGKFQRVK